MRIAKYLFAAMLACTSIAVIATNCLNVLAMPDLLVLKLYLYGLGLLGLAASGALAYETRTGRRLNGKIIGGCFLILCGAAGIVFYPQAYFTKSINPVWFPSGRLSDLVIECCGSAIGLIAGIYMLVSSLRTSKR